MNRRGVTTVETIVAILVIVALAGVLTPFLAATKAGAANKAEMTELHQLGIAQGLYTADTGSIPMSTLTLVQGGYVPASICSSPVDTTVDGLANFLTREMGGHSEIYLKLGTSYRNSYVGLREYNFPYKWMNQYVKGSKGGGWLVSLSTSQHLNTDGNATWYTGDYRRLMLDGSVQVRRHEPVTLQVGNDTMRADHDLFLFLDGTNEWKTNFVSGSR